MNQSANNSNNKTWNGTYEFKLFIKEIDKNKLAIQSIKDKTYK